MRFISVLSLAAALAASCGGNVARDEPPARVCRAGGEGAKADCGADGKTNCCLSAAIPGGTFNRFNDPSFPATVSDFRVDVLEVTVGRFRAFVDAWPSSRPKQGDGAHPRIPASGWKIEWDARLPATREQFSRGLSCIDTPEVEWATWHDGVGPHERAPVSCVTWYEAFAFCAWDGGRLLTEAEWLYLAVGGAEQRKFPWGPEPPDPSRAVLGHTPGGAFARVGSVPAGAARWGLLDLVGSRAEYVRDGIRDQLPQVGLPVPCVDCLRETNTPEGYFLFRDVHFNFSPDFANVGEEIRAGFNGASGRTPVIGIRCAR